MAKKKEQEALAAQDALEEFRPRFLALLGQWGMIGSSCDIDGAGVGINDFLELLGSWGPCPAPSNDECPDKIIIGPGTQVEIPFLEVTETGTSGIMIDATVPVSAAVSIAGPQGVAFVGGVPVE